MLPVAITMDFPTTPELVALPLPLPQWHHQALAACLVSATTAPIQLVIFPPSETPSNQSAKTKNTPLESSLARLCAAKKQKQKQPVAAKKTSRQPKTDS
jgi:hypothetical protein